MHKIVHKKSKHLDPTNNIQLKAKLNFRLSYLSKKGKNDTDY